ncbi:MAG TPA: hypothetical protein VML01_11015 [Bryobacterales bacterium]|nr:hypothetical protein [Bryobacterales bacterium]
MADTERVRGENGLPARARRGAHLCGFVIAAALLCPLSLDAQRFYPDDPLRAEPAPMSLNDARFRKLNDYYDLFTNTFGRSGERHGQARDGSKSKFIPSGGVNTLGEVMDGAWFNNRIGSRAMSIEEVRRGPGDGNAPAMEGEWTIVGAKTQGVTPGFQIRDSKGRHYLLKFDPLGYPEMATGADVIGAHLFHALGYNVPENYLVVFDEDKLVLGDDVSVTDATGARRPMSRRDVTAALARVPRRDDGRIRGVASLFLEGKILAEFRYHGTRSDDFNDIVPHEHRRDLRGLFVFCAWLNHNDSRAINTLDSLVGEDGRKFIRHYLIDFGAIIGSASVVSKTARDGNAYFWEMKPALAQVFSLGIFVPRWARARYIKDPSLGQIEYPSFEPEQWKPNYPNPAFRNRLPDDEFWAAKKVMAFTDEQLRAVVKLAEYSDARAEKWITDYLVKRRDRIGEVYFAKVLPLDDFKVEGGELKFVDLGVKHGLAGARDLKVEWSSFDNTSQTHAVIEGASSVRLPDVVRDGPAGAYFAAKIAADDPKKTITVYLRKQNDGHQVVGIDRGW